MKKIFLFLIIILCVALCGCSSSNSYIKKINIPSVITEDFYLPAQVTNDGKHDIYWTSSDNNIIRVSNSNIEVIDGLLNYKATVNRASVDSNVTLTMTLEVLNEQPIIKEYNVTVLKINLDDLEEIDFNFFALNDFHGAVLSDNGGLSVIGNYIIEEKNKFPDTTVVLSSGDMFQGTALSNMTKGGVVIEIMNHIGFDAMALGNHEFDWGVDIIKNINNKTSDVVANFPIICCNVFEKATDEPVDWCEPYVIVEKGDIKIGIIGAIGSELESSISTKIISQYEFKETLPYIKKYASELRLQKECDLVILSIHDNTTGINQLIADLSGVYQIDAVFNGHTHSTYAGETMGSDNIVMPYIQSGSNGSSIGKITLTYNKNTKTITKCSSKNITVSKMLSSNNLEIDQIIEKHNQNVAHISEEVIGQTATSMDQITVARWAANVIRDYANCEIGFINSGGIRHSAFPLGKNENITVGKMWEIMPFDNFVKTCTMTYEQVIEAYYSYDVIPSDNVKVSNGVLYVNGKKCSEDETFEVSAVDYIFDKTDFPFLKAENQATTGELFRDYLIQAVRDECKDGNKWDA